MAAVECPHNRCRLRREQAGAPRWTCDGCRTQASVRPAVVYIELRSCRGCLPPERSAAPREIDDDSLPDRLAFIRSTPHQGLRRPPDTLCCSPYYGTEADPSRSYDTGVGGTEGHRHVRQSP